MPLIRLNGTPKQGLAGATLGFFVGFAAVALFGPMAKKLQTDMGLSPVALGFAVAAPMLSGSLLRIPFSAWVDTSGGRKPFLMLLSLSTVGMGGLLLFLRSATAAEPVRGGYPLLLALGVLCGCGIATFSVGIGQVSYWFPQAEQGFALGTYAGLGNLAPGIFSFLLPIALADWGLGGTYWAWLIFLCLGTLAYALLGRDAPYFQLRHRGVSDRDARRIARDHGQQLFPSGSVRDGLVLAAGRWRTWALVSLYLATFGGFLALTAWLPVYWSSYFHFTPPIAGILTALFAITASLARVVGGFCADRLNGERTALMALGTLVIGSLLMSYSASFHLSAGAELLMALGMGVNNAAVFKMVPKYVPEAVGGASGWVGGLGAAGGFVLPPLMGFIAELRGSTGYARCFLLFTVLALIGLGLAFVLKASPFGDSNIEIEEKKAQVA
ncbi:MAG TPA: MFS transporter [Candidatus Binataceae bacterium]|jgi:NNP family nitrate/nitrite transporter-like MFS transporter|nr:MFS transporter [Candidatus Binataceae bacterium]